MIEKRLCKFCGLLIYCTPDSLRYALPYGAIVSSYFDIDLRGLIVSKFVANYCHDIRSKDPSKALFHVPGSNLDFFKMKYKKG